MSKSNGLSLSCVGRVARRPRGAVLVTALIFLLIMTLVGVTAMQGTSQQESMASNTRQRNLAFQSAEAAVRAGERVLTNAVLPNFDNTTSGLRQPVMPTTSVGAFWLDAYCWTAAQPGCNPAFAGAREYDGDPNAADPACDLAGNSNMGDVSVPPCYVIEELPSVTLGGSSAKFGALPETGFYRVTARSLGGTADAVVILQTVYRR
jgi:type IV pilus assembly protein PilX